MSKLAEVLRQQDLIIRQQQEMLTEIHQLKDSLGMINFKMQRQHEELNSRLELNERSTRQIDSQIALTNELRRNELSTLTPTLEQLKSLEEFLRLDIATRLMNNID